MESSNFKNSVDELKGHVQEISNDLNLRSVPFFTPRYAGHMCWETCVLVLSTFADGRTVRQVLASYRRMDRRYSAQSEQRAYGVFVEGVILY